MHAAMSVPQVPAEAPPGELRRALARAESRRKWRAFALTAPLLVFLLLTLLVPIVALLQRAVENPEVANALPRTVRRRRHGVVPVHGERDGRWAYDATGYAWPRLAPPRRGIDRLEG